MRRRDGFSLVELLVITVVIGILASIALVYLDGARERAMVGATKSEVRNALTSIERYVTVNGTLPSTIDVLVGSGLHNQSPNVDYCTFETQGAPTFVRLVAAHRGSSTHIEARYPNWGTRMEVTVAASDCSP